MARYGGEEFVAILSDITESATLALAEKMRKTVAARALATTAPGGIVTVIIGIAWARTVSTGSADHIVSSADAALYKAKEKGRNRVEQLVVQEADFVTRKATS